MRAFPLRKINYCWEAIGLVNLIWDCKILGSNWQDKESSRTLGNIPTPTVIWSKGILEAVHPWCLRGLQEDCIQPNIWASLTDHLQRISVPCIEKPAAVRHFWMKKHLEIEDIREATYWCRGEFWGIPSWTEIGLIEISFLRGGREYRRLSSLSGERLSLSFSFQRRSAIPEETEPTNNDSL